MKTRENIESELSSLKSKVLGSGRFACDNRTLGKFIALEWVLGSTSNEAKRKAIEIESMLANPNINDLVLDKTIEEFPKLAETGEIESMLIKINEPESMLTEMQLRKSVESDTKSRKEIEIKLPILNDKLALYSRLKFCMSPSEKIKAGLDRDDKNPITSMIVGMIYALEWAMSSAYEDAKKKKKMDENKPTMGIQENRGNWTKPRSDASLSSWRKKG